MIEVLIAGKVRLASCPQGPLLVFCLLSGLSSHLVFADSTPESQRSKGLEEIVVTAQRREESIRDVPIAMQAFTADTLKKLGVVDTRDLANLVPGFSYADSGSDNPIYTLRGVGFDDSSRTANSAVGVYVDEVPIIYPYMTQGADVDLSRIEVLKGPQGTLYGRNTTGGAINYIANKPTDALEFGVEADYGRFETYSVEGYVSGGITDRLRGRIALRDIQANEGWQISLTRPEDRLGKKDKQAGRATLEWDPLETLRLNLSFDWWRDRSEPQAAQPIAISPQNQELSRDQIHPEVRNHPVVESEDNRLADWDPDFPWQLDNEFLMPALRVYWDVTSDLSLALIASYTDFETGTSWIPRSGLSNDNNELRQSTETTAHTLELRADGLLFSDRLKWLVGYFTSRDSLDHLVDTFAGTASGALNIQPGFIPFADKFRAVAEQDATSDGIFFNGDYTISDSFSVTLGARYTEEERDFFICPQEHPENEGEAGISTLITAISLSQGGGVVEPGDCYTLDEESREPTPVNKELEEDNLGGKVALNWRPTDSHLFYASYSRGFKSGSFPISTNLEESQYDPATQERLDAFELGGKTSWFDDKLRLDFAVFDYDYKDKQLLSFFIDPVFGPLEKLFNVPESRVRGAELEIQSNPLVGLSISAVASFLDTEIEQFVGTTAEGEENVDFAGNEMPFAPDQSLTLMANYRFPLPFFSNLKGSFGIDYSYNSEATSEVEDDPIFTIPSYELVNARIGIGDMDGRWDVIAWGRNITNEFYQLNVPQNTADAIVRYTGMPQTYGITLAYRYF